MSSMRELASSRWAVQSADSQGSLSLAAEIWEAAERIRRHVLVTPVIKSAWLSGLSGGHCWLKLENEQTTGSFKIRGATNKILSLKEDQRHAGIVVASSGNHGLATVAAAENVGVALHKTHVYLPTTASEFKVKKIRGAGAQVVLHGSDGLQAELEAAKQARAMGLEYISPYNDLQVVAGQGTIAAELLLQLGPGEMDTVFVSVGGGGLVSGIAALLKSVEPAIRIIGCQPAADDAMRQSVASGHVVDLQAVPTLSDGTAGGVEPGAVTLSLCSQLVDEWVTVTEAEIAQAMVSMLHHHSKLMEGAVGVAVAAFIKLKEEMKGRNAVIICCGGNISLATLKQVLSEAEPLP